MSEDPMHDFNTRIIEEFRANGGKVSGDMAAMPMVLVTHTGAKSGQQRTSPLVHSRDGDDVVVIASMGGAPKNPQWFHNMVANPRVTVELGAETFEAEAQAFTEGPERDRLYAQQAEIMPMFDEYQQKTDRNIPVVVLKRV